MKCALLLIALVVLPAPSWADAPTSKVPTAEQQLADARIQIAQYVAAQNELYAELLAAQKDATMCKVAGAVRGPIPAR